MHFGLICIYNVGYVEDLFVKLWEVMQGKKSKVRVITSPPPLCSSFERPDKDKAVQQHQSRFSKQS